MQRESQEQDFKTDQNKAKSYKTINDATFQQLESS